VDRNRPSSSGVPLSTAVVGVSVSLAMNAGYAVLGVT
jgi:hypothetical protein